MPKIFRAIESIGENYPTNTDRLLRVTTDPLLPTERVALVGDSTIDNGHWVQNDKLYHQRTGTVRYQTAKALAEQENAPSNYDIACFAIDGAQTEDLGKKYFFDTVINADADHPAGRRAKQLDAVKEWQPDVVVLSVGGNNYRVPLQSTLRDHIPTTKLLARQTPEDKKALLQRKFSLVKDKLLKDYKAIIDNLVTNNPNLKRLVLMNQYYPELTQFSLYFIYTGFSHIANASSENQYAFDMMQNTMNELYREIIDYALTKDKKIILLDVTSSLSPLGDNHVHQIEPNAKGARTIGQLIRQGIQYQWQPASSIPEKTLPVLSYDAHTAEHAVCFYSPQNARDFSVKPIAEFIKQDRYSHFKHFFSPETTLAKRYEHAYHMIMGKDFDLHYRGIHAFGLIDITLVTYVANYLWSITLDQHINMPTRVLAGTVGAPLMAAKLITGIALLIVLGLPIYGLDKLLHKISGEESSLTEEIGVVTPVYGV